MTYSEVFSYGVTSPAGCKIALQNPVPFSCMRRRCLGAPEGVNAYNAFYALNAFYAFYAFYAINAINAINAVRFCGEMICVG